MPDAEGYPTREERIESLFDALVDGTRRVIVVHPAGPVPFTKPSFYVTQKSPRIFQVWKNEHSHSAPYVYEGNRSGVIEWLQEKQRTEDAA